MSSEQVGLNGDMAHGGVQDHSGMSPLVYRRRWWILAVLCLSLLLIVMDNTILNVAIPSLIEDLHATNSQIQWIIDAYVIVFAGLLLTTGSLSDRFGRKGALQLGIVLFGLGSVSAALSHSTTHLIASRAFMGIGGALIMPSTLSLLTNVFRDPKERARAIAVWAGFSGVGVAIGPVVGGTLLNHFSWQSVFWVNIPLGIVALAAGARILPKSRDPRHGDLDPIGATLSVLGLATLLFGIIEGPAKGWTHGLVIGGFIVGILLLAAFVAWEFHTEHPMLDMRFFRNARFTAASSAITITFFALFGSMFLMTQYWQLVQGYSALEAGIRMIPHAATMMVIAPLSARLVERFGTKRVVTTGLSTIFVALLLMSFIHAESSYLHVILIFMLMAAGMAMTMAPATESVMGSLPRNKAGVGSAVNDTTRQMGGALGVATIGSIVAAIYAARIDKIAGGFGLRGSALGTARSSLGGALEVGASMGEQGVEFIRQVREDFTTSVGLGMRVSSIIILIAAILVWRFLPARGTAPAEDSVADVAAVTPADADAAGVTVPAMASARDDTAGMSAERAAPHPGGVIAEGTVTIEDITSAPVAGS